MLPNGFHRRAAEKPDNRDNLCRWMSGSRLYFSLSPKWLPDFKKPVLFFQGYEAVLSVHSYLKLNVFVPSLMYRPDIVLNSLTRIHFVRTSQAFCTNWSAMSERIFFTGTIIVPSFSVRLWCSTKLRSNNINTSIQVFILILYNAGPFAWLLSSTASTNHMLLQRIIRSTLL